MVTISTLIKNVNLLQKSDENLNIEFFEEYDSGFYESIKSELNGLIKNPDEETIAKILAYSKAK